MSMAISIISIILTFLSVFGIPISVFFVVSKYFKSRETLPQLEQEMEDTIKEMNTRLSNYITYYHNTRTSIFEYDINRTDINAARVWESVEKELVSLHPELIEMTAEEQLKVQEILDSFR